MPKYEDFDLDLQASKVNTLGKNEVPVQNSISITFFSDFVPNTCPSGKPECYSNVNGECPTRKTL